jgi:hypothetical protein
MAAFSDYLEEKILEDYLTNGTPYIALHTAAAGPGDTGANEIASSGYARQAATFGEASTDVNGKKVVTTADITFPLAGESWGELGSISIWSAETGGNCLFVAALTANKTVGAGEQLKFTAGEISVKLE